MEKETKAMYLFECDNLERAANSFPSCKIGKIVILHGNIQEVRINLNKTILKTNEDIECMELLLRVAKQTKIKFDELNEKFGVKKRD